MRSWLSFFLLILAGLACSQPIFGPRTYPHFRDMNGLSGNGFPVMRDGTVHLNGAMSLSTPIAYLLAPKQLIVGGASRSFDRSFAFPNTKANANTEKSDGTLQFIGAVDWGTVRIAMTHQVVSPILDNVQNIQFQLPDPDGKYGDWTFSAGIHNIFDRPAANGDADPIEDAKLSRSVFVVGTKDCSREAYFSIGVGDTRYRGVFGSYTQLLNERIRAYLEYDTFNWNVGVASEAGIFGKKAFVQLGLVRGDFLTWSINWVL